MVSGGVTFAAIDAGAVTLCGISLDRSVHCWGINTGFFWDNTIARRTTPVAVPGGDGFETLSTGSGAVCGTTGSDARCLGTLVMPQPPYTLLPISRGADHPFVKFAGGTGYMCAIDNVGGGWCWGWNGDLQVGVNADVPTQTPLQLVIK
jgi:hypothetical protein